MFYFVFIEMWCWLESGSRSGKMMLIRLDPDPQHGLYLNCQMLYIFSPMIFCVMVISLCPRGEGSLKLVQVSPTLTDYRNHFWKCWGSNLEIGTVGTQNSPQSLNFPKAGKCFLVIVGFWKKATILLSNKQRFCFQISKHFVFTMQHSFVSK